MKEKFSVEDRLCTKVMGHPCIYYEETDSTNLRARDLAEAGGPHGALILAEQQTAGRGRRGRSWNSPPGESIYMSLLLRPEISPEHASMLTLVMGLSAAKACSEMISGKLGENAPQVQLKWPNDLVLNGRKVAGILTEMSAGSSGIRYVIIGIGINVNTQEIPKELPFASSLAREAGERPGQKGRVLFDREALAARCLEYFEACYEAFAETEDLRTLRAEYERLLVNKGRMVQVLEPQSAYQGKALGINDRGELLVERENGQVAAVYAGEVSVRGVYGYV